MKSERKIVETSLLASILLLAFATPLIISGSASADETYTQATLDTQGNWTYIQNEIITIAFPANGKKPLFMWWHTDDPDNINVVKFKGLVEYTTYEKPYFTWRCQAEAWRIRERLHNNFYEPRQHMLQSWIRQRAIEKLWEIGNATGLHAPYLPFSSSTWHLDGPVNVTRGDVEYLSFNFTLIDVPGQRPHFQFAEKNVIIRCRFYYTTATETAYGLYNYTVKAGELKMDIVIKQWQWNLDKLEPLVDELRELGLDIPMGKARLALWVNLASINATQIQTAEAEAQSLADADMTESFAQTRYMYVEENRFSVSQNSSANSDEAPMLNRLRERFRIRFERGNVTFAGFFNFVPQAIITDGTTYNTTTVTASYTSAGAHMRLFIGYPYFGNNTLEHDPSIGVESITPWLPAGILMVLIGATVLIAVAVVAVKLRKKTINIIGGQ